MWPGTVTILSIGYSTLKFIQVLVGWDTAGISRAHIFLRISVTNSKVVNWIRKYAKRFVYTCTKINECFLFSFRHSGS